MFVILTFTVVVFPTKSFITIFSPSACVLFVYVFVNGKDLFSLRDVEFQSLSFIEFLDMLVKHTSNNFVDSYFLNQKIQMNLGDYGL